MWDQPRSPEEDSTFMGEVPHDALFFFFFNLSVFLKGLSFFEDILKIIEDQSIIIKSYI